jgi:hypothetical protein
MHFMDFAILGCPRILAGILAFRRLAGDRPLTGDMSLPLEMRLLGMADRLVHALGLFERPLRGQELARLAQRRTGLSDFGGSSFEQPLEVLLQD